LAKIRIIGKKGSKAVKDIIEGTSLLRYNGRKKNIDAVINYGLAGDRMREMVKRYPSLKNYHMINASVGYSKLTAVRRAKDADILVPDSKSSLAKSDAVGDFIEKRTNSIGGIGIKAAKTKNQIPGKYYQQFIKDRRFELRIHAFKWTDNWVVQKRVGPQDAIAWNFKQGGRFISVRRPDDYKVFVEAREISGKILDLLHMSFGAVDFLVDNDYRIYFIEVNSAPGYGDLSRSIYCDAFEALSTWPAKKLHQLH